MDISIEKNLEKITAFFGFVMVLYTFKSGDLRSAEGISAQQYLLFYLIPGVVAGIAFVVSLFVNSNKWRNIVRSVPMGAIYGIGSGYVLLSLIVLFSWYENPDNGKLEPLFVTIGIAIGVAETGRRLIKKLLYEEAADT